MRFIHGCSSRKIDNAYEINLIHRSDIIGICLRFEIAFERYNEAQNSVARYRNNVGRVTDS